MRVSRFNFKLFSNQQSADVRLVRMPLPSLDAQVALSELAASRDYWDSCQLPVSVFRNRRTGPPACTRLRALCCNHSA